MKQITKNKIPWIIKGLKEVLNKKTEQEHEIKYLVEALENALDDILNNKVDKKFKSKDEPRTNEDGILRTEPSPQLKARTEKGHFVLHRGDSQKMDDFRGNKA